MFESCKVCLGGLPGIGSVGKMAADYLSLALDSSPLKTVYSPGFPPQVMVVDGCVRPFSIEMMAPQDRRDIILLTGDAQPLEVRMMYQVADEILEVARYLKVTDLVTMAAYVGDTEDKVVAAASEKSLVRQLEEEGITILRNGFIGGLNGILVGLAPLYGLRGTCLLGSTSGDLPVDLRATMNLVEAVKRLMGLEISLDNLDIVVEEMPEEEPLERDMNYG